MLTVVVCNRPVIYTPVPGATVTVSDDSSVTVVVLVEPQVYDEVTDADN